MSAKNNQYLLISSCRESPLSPRLTHVVQLTRAGVHGLEQLIDLFLRHLLAQVHENVLDLADVDAARQVLVKDLEAAAVLLGLAGVAEAAGPVEHALERLKVDFEVKVSKETWRCGRADPNDMGFVVWRSSETHSHRPRSSPDP